MSSTSIKITAANDAILKQVMDAYNRDPNKFAKEIASNPAALGLSGDTFTYNLTIDGQASSGRVSGGMSIADDSQKNAISNDILNGFDAQPINGKTKTNPNAATGTDLYPSGSPTMEDVNQGQIGDCALDAQLASLAEQDPAAIQNMISRSGDGGYDVTLYPHGQKTDVHVTQADMDAIQGTKSASGKTDWASVIEAGVIKSGQDFSRGSDPAEMMGVLTGTKGSDGSTSSLGGSTSSILAALSSGKLVSASASVSSGDIVGNHAYSVLSATANTVTVRNPWGVLSANDGVLTMSIADFQSKFDGLATQA